MGRVLWLIVALKMSETSSVIETSGWWTMPHDLGCEIITLHSTYNIATIRHPTHHHHPASDRICLTVILFDKEQRLWLCVIWCCCELTQSSFPAPLRANRFWYIVSKGMTPANIATHDPDHVTDLIDKKWYCSFLDNVSWICGVMLLICFDDNEIGSLC